jgi:hypothetical protein
MPLKIFYLLIQHVVYHRCGTILFVNLEMWWRHVSSLITLCYLTLTLEHKLDKLTNHFHPEIGFSQLESWSLGKFPWNKSLCTIY